MNVVIPLHEWSGTKNLELRYALRSFEQYMPHDAIVLIGFKPSWIKNVIHIPFKDDPKPQFRDANIFLKLKYFIDKHNAYTTDFIYANDDHFLLEQFIADEYPHKGDLKRNMLNRANDDPYRKTIFNTALITGERVFNFDVHRPMTIVPDYFNNAFIGPDSKHPIIDWSKPFGYLMKTLYMKATPFAAGREGDWKFTEMGSGEQVWAMRDKMPFFSLSDKAVDQSMIDTLQKLYPNKSKYE